MKIHIIGCSGSGKTYLAQKLSTKYKIPHFDLDDIQWDDHVDRYGVKRPEDIRKKMLGDLLSNDDWIIEGVYYSWVEQSFEEADVIYLLDMPKRIYISRILFRFVKRKLKIEKGKKETWKSVIGLLKWTDTFQTKNMPEIRSILKKYGDKTIRLSSRKQVREVLSSEPIL